MPVSAPSTFLYGAHVRATGIRQHYLRFGGSGAPMVIVPGITSPAATWSFVAERLAVDRDVYVVDLRGRGLSQGGPELDYSLDAYASDVAEFARSLDLDRYAVVGHSLGARIATRLGSRANVPFSKLVLADPPVSGPGRRPYGKSLEFYLSSIRKAGEGRLDLAAMRQSYPTWGDEQLRARAQWLHTCDEAAIAKSVAGFQDEDIHKDFPLLQAPTLLLVAGQGGTITQDDISEIRGLLPSIQVRTIEKAGHMIPFDRLEDFLAEVTRFLES